MHQDAQQKLYKLYKSNVDSSNQSWVIDVLLSFFTDFSEKTDFFSYFSMKSESFQPMKQHNFFEKPDWRFQKTCSEKSDLYSSMQFHLLFRMVKTRGLHLIPIESYFKNTHSSFNLKWTLVKTTENLTRITM